MSTLEIIGLILGSNVIIELIKQLFKNKQIRAGAIKLRNEAGQIVLEGELRVTEFYKEQLEDIMAKYLVLERKLDEEIFAHSECEAKIRILEAKHADLQRQFTLLKTQMNSGI